MFNVSARVESNRRFSSLTWNAEATRLCKRKLLYATFQWDLDLRACFSAALALVRYYPKTVTAPRDESIKKERKSFLPSGELLIVEIN